MSEAEAMGSALRSRRLIRFEAPAGAGALGMERWSASLALEEQLAFWREASSSAMAMALYALCGEEGGGRRLGEPEDVWGWRLMGFLRRHCEALCALREESGARLNAARALASLDFERVMEIALMAPEPAGAGLRKYISEINGSRPCADAAGRPQAARAHGQLTMVLVERLSHLSRFERAAVAAGRAELPSSLGQLRSWVEAAELERGCAAGERGERSRGDRGSL